jgi:hypothetical protein
MAKELKRQLAIPSSHPGAVSGRSYSVETEFVASERESFKCRFDKSLPTGESEEQEGTDRANRPRRATLSVSPPKDPSASRGTVASNMGAFAKLALPRICGCGADKSLLPEPVCRLCDLHR